MGYYTDFNLTAVLDIDTQDYVDDDVTKQLKALGRFLNSSITRNENYDDKMFAHRWWAILELIENDYVNATWYTEEKNMKEFSTYFPEYVFVIDGDGEESGDVWQTAYHNGKENTEYVKSPMANTVTFRKDRS